MTSKREVCMVMVKIGLLHTMTWSPTTAKLSRYWEYRARTPTTRSLLHDPDPIPFHHLS